MAFVFGGHFYLKNLGGECCRTQPPKNLGAVRPPTKDTTETDDTTYFSESQEDCEAGAELPLAEALFMPLRQLNGMGSWLRTSVFCRFFPSAGNASVSMSVVRMCDPIEAERLLSTYPD